MVGGLLQDIIPQRWSPATVGNPSASPSRFTSQFPFSLILLFEQWDTREVGLVATSEDLDLKKAKVFTAATIPLVGFAYDHHSRVVKLEFDNLALEEKLKLVIVLS
ncbi:hypothetical protein CRG98_005921 [Punica granatum]|uniref:Uncharacterized protein n=1 Tax=Punica granatum TaxID=22663 RepID=A0A2I0KZC3_PUNGR|nr:hypothetical protein CRG98_005921 [Punica granatum]